MRIKVTDLLNDVRDRNGKEFAELVEAAIEDAYDDGFEAGVEAEKYALGEA